MLEQNKTELEILNVSEWHRQGFTGKNIIIGNGEKWDLNDYSTNCLDPLGHCGSTSSTHGQQVARAIHEIAPDCQVACLRYTSTAYIDNCIEYIKANDVKLLTLSLSTSSNSTDWNRTTDELQDVSFFVCSGNDGDDDYNGRIRNDDVFGVGAIKEDLEVASYSSESSYVDFGMFTDIYTDKGKFTGTSCATPVLCALSALIQDFFNVKTGRQLTREELRLFLTDYSVDINNDGIDDLIGHGMPILPNPQDIEIERYVVEFKGVNDLEINQLFLTENDCYKSGKSITPQGVMIHSTGVNNPNINRYVPIGAYSSNHWNKSGISKCVHAFIGKNNNDVEIWQTLPWEMRGWHAGGEANGTHIGFEICEDDLTDYDYFIKVYDTAVDLTALLCDLYNLDPFSKGVVISHAEGYQLDVASNHADIDHWLTRFGYTMDIFRKDVQIKLDDIYNYKLEVADWAKASWDKATAKGILDGTRPTENMTRQELAVVLDRLNLLD